MAKEDVKQAINETIVSNGKRGITAQSLANVLNLMVDEGGSGSGAAMLCPKFSVIDYISSLYVTADQREYNKMIFDTVKEAFYAGESVPMIGLNFGELIASTPEGALYGDMGVYMAPIVYGYMNGLLALEEFGTSEIIYSQSMIGPQFVILPSGDIILMDD